MSRTILALALASSVSALLPAKVPGRVRGVYSAPLASSSALLSMRSRPPYMSIDPDTHAKIAAAGYSSGFSDGFSAGQNTAAMVLVSDPPATTPELQRCIDAADQIKGVDGPLLQTLATVCCTIEDAMPNKITLAVYEPKGEASASAGAADHFVVNDQLDQPFQVEDGGVGGLDAFKSSLASYGTVLDSIIDFHGDFEVAVPPFAAVVIQPGPPAPSEAFIGDPILILAWRGSHTLLDWVNDFAFSPTLSTRWSSETKEINAHGAFVNLVENTFSRHEDAMVDLIMKHGVKRVFFTGHSLGGGIANVAHLVARAQLKKAGSPWYKLDGEVDCLACTFASPPTIVRLYEPKPPPQLIVDLDASSSNLVYGCDIVPRPGMLAYVGNLLEIVVPQITDEDLPKLPFFKNWVRLVKLETVAGGAVKKLKTTGTAYVANSLTHVGTVVYQKSEHPGIFNEKDKKYMYLKTEAKIREVLDVKDKGDFEKLWGNPKTYFKSFLHAHLHLAKFVPGAKFPEKN